MKNIFGSYQSLIKSFCITIFVVLLSGCSAKTAEQLVGKWERTNAREAQTFEFRKDGSYSYLVAVVFGVNGNYKVIDGNLLQLLKPNGAVFLTATVSFSDNVLTLSQFSDNSPTATYRRIEEVKASQADQTLAGALKDQQEQLNAQPVVAGTQESSLPKLSAAAEKAIQEGFVEIKDPKVQACTDAKVAAIRKQAGADATIGFESYNEAAVACGYNL